MHELPLVFFTVLAQGAAGLFFVLAALLFINKDAKRKVVLDRLMIVAFIAMAIAGPIAMLHLGQPLRAFNVLFGLEHFSALSLEIMAVGGFTGLIVIYLVLALKNLLPALHKPVLFLAMVMAIVLVIAISHVYTLDTVPTWNSGWTLFQFAMTATILGLPAAATALRYQSDKLGVFQRNSDKALATLGLLAMGASLIGFALYLFWMGQLTLPVNPFTAMEYHSRLLAARLVLLFLGMSLWVVSSLRGNNGTIKIAGWGTALILFSELAGRIFFYDLHISSGM
ncbi:Anaerobic dimethyl sulfoxide reductase chain C [invertebrate metagenome]|uniref:Anaerobic dimethyl sulfoxide reductase chain C n=1 Tax=invertebrate metagenome TaxID=1711999 RepID=A0A2H9T5H6_9ZZZZ